MSWTSSTLECVERLDVALLNGILKNPENNFPNDPFADPIIDLSILLIPSVPSTLVQALN